ncbi:hypothetical protein PPYR_02358 [Photinus pyralis]|uniref:Uncharacterized protein n=1 Tax=Photinus pyralis TaxID=7054 RepID=A0A5N4B752_PHOPY|nr:hypothetical protein PPYR_02358 [Photinus pyralis]
METDLGVLAVTILNGMAMVKLKSKRKRSRKCWVKGWVDRRGERGIMQLVNKELSFEDPEAFRNYIRMSKESFMKFLQKLEPQIAKINTNMRESESYRNLMYSTRIHESTISLFIPEVCKAIYLMLKDEYLQVSSTSNRGLGKHSK